MTLYTGTLHHKGDEHAMAMILALDTDQVPILSPHPEPINLPLIDKPGEQSYEYVFFLDRSRLTQEQNERVVLALAQRFQVTPEEVESEITGYEAHGAQRRHGLPIRLTNCTLNNP